MPFEIDQSQKNSYDQLDRLVAMRHYQHHWSGISVLGNTQIFYHPNGHLGGYTFVSTTPTENSFKFEQNFDHLQRLTAAKSYYTIQGQLQLYEGDSLQYLTQNDVVTEIIDRTYDFQRQQWVLFQRYTQLQIDSTNQQITAFRAEAWSDSLSSWQLEGDYKSMRWGFGYEGLHEIAQMRIFNLIREPYRFPSHRPSTTPFPSQLVYGIDTGTQFDTLWHYRESLAGGRVMQVERDVFVAGQRTPFDRLLLDYDAFGLLNSEKLQFWTGSHWQGASTKEAVRNADQNVVSQRDSSYISALGALQLSSAYSYDYDSLPTGQISQFTRTAEHHVIPYPYERNRFWYDGLSSTVPSMAVEDLRAYPNPFETGFWVEELADGGVLACYNAAGQLVEEKMLAAGQTWVDGSRLAPGLYLFQFSAKGKLYQKRLLKLP